MITHKKSVQLNELSPKKINFNGENKPQLTDDELTGAGRREKLLKFLSFCLHRKNHPPPSHRKYRWTVIVNSSRIISIITMARVVLNRRPSVITIMLPPLQPLPPPTRGYRKISPISVSFSGLRSKKPLPVRQRQSHTQTFSLSNIAQNESRT